MSEADLYSTYVSLKGWGKGGDESSVEYDAWLAPYVMPRCRLLDIGFGDGVILRWARRRGCMVSGIEIIPELLLQAQEQGFEVWDEIEAVMENYDVISAIDVFEHLTVGELSSMMSECRRLLKPGGFLVAKFPNGASPFSGYYQASDATHLKALSPRALEQIATPLGFEMDRVFSPRVDYTGTKRQRVTRAIKYSIRNVVERVYCSIYFDHRFPIDPNVAVVLRAV